MRRHPSIPVLTWLVAACVLAPAVSMAAKPSPYPVIVVFATAAGGGPQSAPISPLLDETWETLPEMLNGTMADALAGLVVPTACGEVRIADCGNLHIIKDVEWSQTMQRLGRPEAVLVVRPAIRTWTDERVYHASLDVTLLSAETYGKEVPYTFAVTYMDWECDPACVTVAHRYAAEEFGEMVAYILAVERSEWPRQLPPSWEHSPKVKSVSRWSNKCVRDVSKRRVVRNDRDRAWLGSMGQRRHLILSSLAWTGCASGS